MKNKILIIVMVICVLLSAFPVVIFAQDNKVYDFADLLTDEEEQQLSQLVFELDMDDIYVGFLTVDDTEGKSTMVYADDFYDENINEFGYDGILFVIDMDNRDVYINTVGVCIKKLSDSTLDSILDEYTYLATGEQYYKFFENTCEDTCEILIKGINEEEKSPIIPSPLSLIISLICTAIVILVLWRLHNKQNEKTVANAYSNNSFEVINRNERFIRDRVEIIKDYYKPKESSKGGSSHRSSGGISHGGRGKGF